MTQITPENFDSYLNSDNSVIYLSAAWCGPCRLYAPIVEKVSAEMPDTMFGKIDVEQNKPLAVQLEVKSIPTTIVIKNGQIVERFVGPKTKNELEQIIKG